MKLTHKTARGVLIATDTIATNSYWMVDTTHPAYNATVDRLGGINRSCTHFKSWDVCRDTAGPFNGDLSIGKVFTDTIIVDGKQVPRPWFTPEEFSDSYGFVVHNDFTPILDGYELRCFVPLASMRDTAGQVGLYEDDGRLVGVVMAYKLP